jgi:hypothetical protein
MKNKKKLPIGVQTFNELIKENYLYIDKTKDIYNLLYRGANTISFPAPGGLENPFSCLLLRKSFLTARNCSKSYGFMINWIGRTIIFQSSILIFQG